ncbi:glycosyltransferase family A protein [Halomonas sp. LR5S13]|uniref:glycosyltransferase family A protein n=1 Tax=Halomonas rhizosphaerae TaxID=3043296 RepID=UPI0024A92AE6|nr:glycosyltransferase family A protein [Halomonas rhizosphaerae]MDI5921863.1 glycosyltransferase family A protein [Halomonas rhizosphaerae]
MASKDACPFFSIVMPVYNKERFVGRAIESVLNQEYSNFELIVVCDPSTDGSSAKVASFNDDRLRVFHRDNPGPGGYAARNLGIMNSCANWICFLDADDEWLPNHLVNSKEAIEKYPDINFISNNYATVSDLRSPGFTEKSEFKANSSGKFSREDALRFLASKDIFHTNGVVLKKEVILAAGMFPDGKTNRAGDVDLFLKAVITTEHVYISDIVTSLYYVDESGVVKNVESTGKVHPVTITVKSLLYNISEKATKKNLMLLSNRKAVAWSMQRKMGGMFEFSELANLFFSQLSLTQWIRVPFLLMPNGVVKVYKKLSSRD